MIFMKKDINYKKQITALSIAALCFKIIYCIYCIIVSGGMNLLLFCVIIDVIPYILFIIYICKYYKQSKSSFLLLLVFISNIIMVLLAQIPSYYYDYYDVRLSIFTVVFYSLFYVFPIIGLLNVNLKKKFIKIPLIIYIGYLSLVLLLGIIMSEGDFGSIISAILEAIAPICLYIGILLFVSKNVIYHTILVPLEKMKPEKALEILKVEFENGEITEEEYQAKREKIIKKL